MPSAGKDDAENTSKQFVMTGSKKGRRFRFGWRRETRGKRSHRGNGDRNLLNLLNLENDFEQNCEKKDTAETVERGEEVEPMNKKSVAEVPCRCRRNE